MPRTDARRLTPEPIREHRCSNALFGEEPVVLPGNSGGHRELRECRAPSHPAVLDSHGHQIEYRSGVVCGNVGEVTLRIGGEVADQRQIVYAPEPRDQRIGQRETTVLREEHVSGPRLTRHTTKLAHETQQVVAAVL